MMKAFRTQVTLLLMTAMILISVLSILATFVVYRTSLEASGRTVYHYNSTDQDTSTGKHVVIASGDVEWAPDFLVLMGYGVLIATSAAVVSIIVGNMIVRPLETLQKAIETVNPQAIIPKMAERGDGSALITVRLLNTLSETLKRAMESRMRLVAAAGHDLRTPLTRMRLRAEMIDDDADRTKWIGDVDEMMHIADSAISLVREEAESREYEKMSFDGLVSEIVDQLADIGHRVKITHMEPAEILGGPIAIKRAMTNLLVNACTHGKNARVNIARDGAQVVCSIIDDGPGIPEELIQHAFEPFFRAAPARKKTTKGAGLGLAIVKEIITRHGGTIKLANRKPHGLYQEVVFPAA